MKDTVLWDHHHRMQSDRFLNSCITVGILWDLLPKRKATVTGAYNNSHAEGHLSAWAWFWWRIRHSEAVGWHRFCLGQQLSCAHTGQCCCSEHWLRSHFLSVDQSTYSSCWGERNPQGRHDPLSSWMVALHLTCARPCQGPSHKKHSAPIKLSLSWGITYARRTLSYKQHQHIIEIIYLPLEHHKNRHTMC